MKNPLDRNNPLRPFSGSKESEYLDNLIRQKEEQLLKLEIEESGAMGERVKELSLKLQNRKITNQERAELFSIRQFGVHGREYAKKLYMQDMLSRDEFGRNALKLTGEQKAELIAATWFPDDPDNRHLMYKEVLYIQHISSGEFPEKYYLSEEEKDRLAKAKTEKFALEEREKFGKLFN